MLLRVNLSISTSSRAMSLLLMKTSTHVSFSSGVIVKFWSIDPCCKSSVCVCVCVCVYCMYMHVMYACVFVFQCLCVCVFVHVRA